MKKALARPLAAIAFLLFMFAGAASAQNATTTGQIRGRVTGENDVALAGATVVARNVETGLERGAVSDADGAYALRLLPPGTYRVRAEMLGHRTEEVPTVRVTIGLSATANFQLSPQAVALDAIEITSARQPVDVTDASIVQTVGREEIEELPVLGRDFTDFIALSSIVAPDPGVTTGGQFSIAGQRGSMTNLQIDGVDANNSFFGENRGGSRIPFVFSLESIEEFQIITNGYDVEYGNYSGGIVNVVTRGGTNDMRGTLFGNFRSDALTGKGFLDTLGVKDFSVAQFAGKLSGPIKRDKAFFLFSLDGQRRREPQIPLTLNDFAPGGEDEDPVAHAEMQRFFQILRDVYGIQNPESGFRPFQTSNDVISAFGRVDWNLNDKHRLSMRHNYATYNNNNEWAVGFDFIYGQSRAEVLEDDSHSFVTELQSVFSQNSFNVARFQFAFETRPRQGNEIRPALITRLSNGQQIGYGGSFVGYNNFLDERKLQFIDNFTHVRGAHTLKVGGNAMLTHIKNQFLPALSAPCGVGSQGAGVFCFNNLNDFEAGRAASYSFNVQSGGGLPLADFDGLSLSIYAQDEWQATPKLTVTAGVRHDRQKILDDPGRVIDVERAFAYPTGTAPEDNDNISPRLALAYDVQGNGRSVIRAGAGYFISMVPYVLAGNVMGSARPVLNLSCRGNIARGDADAPPNPRDYSQWSTDGLDNPTACAGQTGLGGVPTYTVWHEDFEYPETFKANLGYERMLGLSSVVSVDAHLTRSSKLYNVRNLNLRPVQFVIEEEGGRRIYTPAELFAPAGGNAPNARLNTEFGDVFANYNDGAAQSVMLTLEGSHRFRNNASLRGSYSFMRAYDNSSYSCCTASSGFANPRVGAFGPNDIGGNGDEEKAWGLSDFNRDHTLVLSGFTRIPFGFNLATIWRMQSGRPYSPEVSGDLNGDGVSFNDRPFIFAPADLPLASNVANPDSVRQSYANVLAQRECIGDYVGQIIPRNTCRQPWSNSLDMRLSRSFPTVRGQRAELQIDFFNVLNGIGRALCSAEDFREDPTQGTCGWGRRTIVSGSDRNIFQTSGFDVASERVTYTPSGNFGRERVLGDNLALQFQMQLGLRYTF